MNNQIKEFGIVNKVEHSLVEIEGLPNLRVGELVEFEKKQKGQVLSFNQNSAQILLLDSQAPRINSKCFHYQDTLTISFSEQILGQTIDPLGNNLFQETDIEKNIKRTIDLRPPTLKTRKTKSEQLVTGVSIVDLMLPIAKGQRELIIGDRKTGKTSFLLNAAEAQSDKDTIIVYALIGKKITEIKQLYKILSQKRFADQTIIVATNTQDPTSLISLTPFSAMALAEYFRDQNREVLVFLDDLSTHAKFYRETALLSKQFPGRDSYPGDIFYTHARLLERAGNFQNGSITCFPVAETTENDLTDFIVSNLISITDGHLLFDYNLFLQGNQPAINTFLSVTRIGKQTQTTLARNANQKLNAFMNQYQKIDQLSHFGAELNPKTRKILEQGEMLREMLSQATLEVVPLSVQLAIVALVQNNFFENTENIHNCRENIINHYAKDSSLKQRLDKLAELKKWEEYREKIKKLDKAFKKLCQH